MLNEHLCASAEEQPICSCQIDQEDRGIEGEDIGVAIPRAEIMEDGRNTSENAPNSHHHPRYGGPKDESFYDCAIALFKLGVGLDVTTRPGPVDRSVCKANDNADCLEEFTQEKERVHKQPEPGSRESLRIFYLSR